MMAKISSPAMLQWQLDRLTGQFMLVGDHAADQSCPCTYGYRDPTGKYVSESCIPKHLLCIYEYCVETAVMTDNEELKALLTDMAEEARGIRNTELESLCGKEVEQTDITDWARDKRKSLEPYIHEFACVVPEGEKTGTLHCCTYRMKLSGEVLLTCRKNGGVLDGLYPSLKDAEEEAVSFCGAASSEAAAVEEIAEMFRKKAEPRWCYPVKETDKELGELSRTLGTAKKRIAVIQKSLEMPLNICRGQAELFESTTGVLDPYGSRCRDPETGQWTASGECGYEPAGITTTALGMDGITRYEFEFKIVSLDKLVVSHDPFTFAVNPDYPAELQPRLRERAATKIQVEKIAANLEPDAVITDFHVIDRGTPIVGPDLVVEAGNGRVMGIARAAADYPEKYADYKENLASRAHDYGLSAKDVDSIEKPVLVRLRISDVDRTTFAQEANQAATIAPSAIENARTDAQKITMGMLQELVIGENESLEDALRAPKNQAFAKRFLATLPENVQAALVDAQGYLNRDGVHRMAMAVFVSAFQGDPGLRLAEKAFESVDMDVRNTVNAIARSLGPLAQAESLTRSGERDTGLSIGDDLAQTVNVYSAIKRNPALTVEKYLAQEQIFARELTPFQEGILVVLEEYKRSPRKLGNIFTAYAEGVIAAPPPAQAALFPGAEITKEGLWESAIAAPEPQPVLMEVIRMFEETCERPSARYQHLAGFFTESAAEAALFAAEEGVTERKIDTVLAQLESGIAEIHDGANFKAFVDTMAKFHNYSLGNIMLITLQRPGATNVAGYRTWQDLGRNVKKSEHGIMILAPCFPPKPKKEKEEDEEEIEPEPSPIHFKVVHVFDVDQTEGKELPMIEVPVITGDETAPLYKDFLSYVAKQGFTFSDVAKPDIDPGIMGFWMPAQKLIWVRPEVPQDQRTKTLLHEIAHAKCEMRGIRDAEVMAESVAYTVANHFGFDTGTRSFPYVAVWAKDVKVLKANLETIRKVAKDMIEGLEHVTELSEVPRMFERPESDKQRLIRGILDMEIWLGQLDLGKTRDRVKSLARLKVKELDDLYHDLVVTKIDWNKLVEQSVYTGMGKTVPAYLQEVARMFEKADACREIRDMLKSQPSGAGEMLAWAERLKVQADRAEGCQSLQEAAYSKAFEVIKVTEPMLKPAKVEAPLKLLTKEIRGKLPPLYSQEEVEDPIVQVKFFTPDAQWTWYGIEFDSEDLFFGWVVGFEKELGYFSLKELESARGPLGLAIERDKWFKPMPLSEVKKLHQHERGELAQGLMPAIGSAAITGIGIGAGFKLVDWVAGKFSKRELKEDTRHIPAYVDVFKTTIAKHYRPTEDFHEGSIRVGKPEEDILVYLGCLKSDDWDGERCSPNPTVLKTIVPNNKKYREELAHLKNVHPEIKINYQEGEVGVEPAVGEEEQEELEAVDEALNKAEEI